MKKFKFDNSIDPKTGKPRKGKWVKREWVPANPEFIPTPQSNPNFSPESITWFGRGKEEK